MTVALLKDFADILILRRKSEEIAAANPTLRTGLKALVAGLVIQVVALALAVLLRMLLTGVVEEALLFLLSVLVGGIAVIFIVLALFLVVFFIAHALANMVGGRNEFGHVVGVVGPVFGAVSAALGVLGLLAVLLTIIPWVGQTLAWLASMLAILVGFWGIVLYILGFAEAKHISLPKSLVIVISVPLVLIGVLLLATSALLPSS